MAPAPLAAALPGLVVTLTSLITALPGLAAAFQVPGTGPVSGAGLHLPGLLGLLAILLHLLLLGSLLLLFLPGSFILHLLLLG